MSVLKIITLTINEFHKKNTPLSIKCQDVIDFGKPFQEIVDNIIETLKHHKIAIALAAPQVGIYLRLAVINLNKNKEEPTLILVNPVVTSSSGKRDKKKESCMSFPHYRAEVERRDKIQISYKNRDGQPEIFKAEGFLARVIAHELDHLDGILYIDKVESISKLEPTDIFK